MNSRTFTAKIRTIYHDYCYDPDQHKRVKEYFESKYDMRVPYDMRVGFDMTRASFTLKLIRRNGESD